MKSFVISKIVQFSQFFFRNANFYLKFKDIVLLNPSEHLIRSVGYIRNRRETHFKASCIIDIGAADGGTALFFSKNFPECSVVGFEPIYEMYTKAVNSCSGESRISFRNIALSNSAGTGELSVTANYLSSSLNQLDEKEIGKEPGEQQDKLKELRKEVVRVSTLDIEAENILHPLLLKLDTQGTELQVLEGGKKVLERTEFVLIEMNNHKIYKNTCQYFEVDRFLRASNFQLVDIIVTYRDRGFVKEFDALYENLKFVVPRNS